MRRMNRAFVTRSTLKQFYGETFVILNNSTISFLVSCGKRLSPVSKPRAQKHDKDYDKTDMTKESLRSDKKIML